MALQIVHQHKRKGKLVATYKRTKRPASKKKIIGSKPVRLYPVYDEYRQFKGWSRVPPAKK